MISLLQTIDQQNRSENAKISYTNTIILLLTEFNLLDRLGLGGFEPPTSPTPRVNHTKLDHSPVVLSSAVMIPVLDFEGAKQNSYPGVI